MADKQTSAKTTGGAKKTLPPGEQYKRDLAARRKNLRKAYGIKAK